MPTSSHIPVLLHEAVSGLCPCAGGTYVDGTFGRGGYSRAILATEGTKVFGIDRDPEASEAGREVEKKFAGRFKFLPGTFGDMAGLLARENVTAVDGIALDVGVSSPQIDEASRGFSFANDGPLDMRMGDVGETASDIVNTRDEKELADIIYQFGEERFARRIARKIVEHRNVQKLTRTKELAELVRSVVPRSKDGIDPATRTFQALRIAVNDELDELKRGLEAAEKLLKPSGRLAVVSFHSLEDRIVKDFLRERSGKAAMASRHLPAVSKSDATFALVSKKPVLASEDEVRRNPRARSAKLRLAERIDASKECAA
jgi:16S rRNA (cytosine1402-N4)-methyltransferase